MKLFEKIKVNAGKTREREIRFLNIPIVQYGKKEENGVQEKYLEILPRSLRNKLFNKLINHLNKLDIDFDDIYISRMNIGETVLLAGLIKNWFKLNNSRKPIIILTQEYHKDIFDLYCPNVNYIYYPISKSILDNLLHKINFKFKNHHFYYFITIIIGMLGKKGIHFSKFIKDILKIDSYEFPNQISSDGNIPQKFLDTGININKFVILSPEAISLNSPDMAFWTKLAKEFNNLGYSVFCNITKEESYIPGTYTTQLSLKELYSVAKYSKAIIGLRSGLMDFLASIENLKIIALYASLDYWEIPAEKVLKTYTLKELPFKHSTKIVEYSLEDFSTTILINKIIKNLSEGES